MVEKTCPKECCQSVDSSPGDKMMKGVLQSGIHDFGNMFQGFTSLQMFVCFFTYGQHMADHQDVQG